MDVRTLAAGGLGVALGLLLIAAPELVLRAQTAGRLPPERRGHYGEDGQAPDRWRRLLQLVGVGLVVAGAWFGYAAF